MDSTGKENGEEGRHNVSKTFENISFYQYIVKLSAGFFKHFTKQNANFLLYRRLVQCTDAAKYEKSL